MRCRLSLRRKLHSEYYGEDSDYTHKGGVICSKSCCRPCPAKVRRPGNAMERRRESGTGKEARLAYSFDIALQNEFSIRENIDLAEAIFLENDL